MPAKSRLGMGTQRHLGDATRKSCRATARQLQRFCSHLQEPNQALLPPCLQVQNGHEVKMRCTSKNWQQELLRLFPLGPRTTTCLTPALDIQTAPVSTAPAGGSQAASDAQTALVQPNLQPAAAQGGGSQVASDAQTPGEPARGYWREAPGVRLSLLRELCHAALDSYIMR